MSHLTDYSSLDYSSIRMKILKGVPASPGIGIGRALVFTDNENTEIPRYTLGKDKIESELARLSAAYEAAETELKSVFERALQTMGKEAEIFTAHLAMVQDPVIREQVAERVYNMENAEWAVWDTAANLMRMMNSSPDPAFRERAVDIKDITRRILNQLINEKKPSLSILNELNEDVVIVAHDLLPSEILAMETKHVKAIVIDQGGPTSHVAILARAFNIPAVLGLAQMAQEIAGGDNLIVDGSNGEVHINPENDDLQKYRQAHTQYYFSQTKYSELKDIPAVTKDGHCVSLYANIGIPKEAETALQYGAEGIGLYRTEFLFIHSGRIEDEEHQYLAYSAVVKTMGQKPVTIRTIDIGGDKTLPNYGYDSEPNPLLGWRAIRFSLAQPELFKAQLRAILRASVTGNVRIMFPLISGIEELEQALALLEEAKTECRKKGQAYNEKIEAGIMIEVPSAAIIADLLAKKSQFFSIGTNDLVQYSLAVDRENEKVNYLAQPVHPAVLRFLKMTIDAAHSQGIKAAMCGEMAGDPALTALLLGLGLDEFSMTASSIPRVKRVIRDISLEDCRALDGEVLKGASIAENSHILKIWMKERGL
jgi:phosphotransferase system enzyme I (PtsI)